MSLSKILVIITSIWMVFKVKHFISKIKIASGKSTVSQKKNRNKAGMDIQDADYEEVE